MTRIIGIFDHLTEAQSAVNLLAASGLEPDCLSIIGRGSQSASPQSRLKQSAIWGSALGVAVALILPHGGILYLAGHLARAAALHVLGVTVKGLLVGAAVGGGLEVLRHAGLDQRAAQEAAEIIKSGRIALALKGDWVTVQRARFVVGYERTEANDYLVDMVRRFGYEHQSFLSLYGGMAVWSSAEPEAAIVYRRVGRVAVVVAAPLTEPENMAVTIRCFLDYCDGQKLACLMLPIGAQNAEIARACGMGMLPIGESGYFDLSVWKPVGDRCKKVRAGANQARRAGVTVERYDPPTVPEARSRAEIEVLCQEWLSTRRMEALGWLLELNPFKLSEYKRYFLARAADGRLEGLLACCPIPARQGWYLEDLIRRPGADRGVSELLVTEAIKDLAAEGAKLATLGTSPLAGIEPIGQFKNLARFLNLVYEHLDTFYHFKGLHRFKSKFAPSFVDPEYVVFHPPRIRLRMVLAVIGAFDPGGLTKTTAAMLHRLWRERHKPKLM
jgi:lysylphosphatidylglycerol synthetase-like protein (DUF2156 family)